MNVHRDLMLYTLFLFWRVIKSCTSRKLQISYENKILRYPLNEEFIKQIVDNLHQLHYVVYIDGLLWRKKNYKTKKDEGVQINEVY